MEPKAPHGLRYANLASPGLSRAREADGFRYLTSRGKDLHDPRALKRIRQLAIPPAWEDVWISADPDGHIQAVGRDAKGRKQYRYHARWRQARDEAKYERLPEFASKLPALRARTARDLNRPDLDQTKVVAAVIRLLEGTLIRVGNEEYARRNRSYGLTTLRDRHVTVKGPIIEFRFRGKSGKDHVVTLKDARLAGIVKACQDLPGRTLFQCIGVDGNRRSLTSADVNAYIRDAMSADFSAKDFRTWSASVLAAALLRKEEAAASHRDGARRITRAVSEVASRLGNTPAICRKSYIHPAVFEAYLDGSLAAAPEAAPGVRHRLRASERMFVAFLRSHSHPPDIKMAA